MAGVFRMDRPMNVHIKVENELLKELAFFDAERKEDGGKVTITEIKTGGSNDKSNIVAN